MEIIGAFALVLLALAIFGTPLVFLYQVIEAICNYFLSDWWNRRLPFTPVDFQVKHYLEVNCAYYQHLNESERTTFIKRVQKFRRMKTFEGREGLYVTVEMELLVCAAAVQITFGHPSVYFRHFKLIVLYPDVYYSTTTDAFHKGEVNTGGVIVLSWKNLLQGFTVQHDGINLGLHEMAHALKLVEHGGSRTGNFFDRKTFFQFMSHARAEMQRINENEVSLFRKYAATNDHEFFAVAVENFFERPKAFSTLHPTLYDLLAGLMNQNPAIKRFS
ncbi:MAG TPA: zinc-dependent peptidase [Chryseosolibacter sp.]|nr:zinc-dependent peptidase [Chryseosolibacter sp.]